VSLPLGICFEFDSAHAGYGGRTGQVVAEVITHHRASITVEQMKVVSQGIVTYNLQAILRPHQKRRVRKSGSLRL